MKLICLYATMPEYDLGLKKANMIMEKVFEELNVSVEKIDVHDLFLPYYNGKTLPVTEEIAAKIDESDGVIFSFTSSLGAPCGVMQTFIEHLQNIENRKFLYSKNCMIISVTENKTISGSLRYFSDLITYFKGFSSVVIGLTRESMRAITYKTEAGDVFEKQIEDFYRIVNQKRKFFLHTNEEFLFMSSGNTFESNTFESESADDKYDDDDRYADDHEDDIDDYEHDAPVIPLTDDTLRKGIIDERSKAEIESVLRSINGELEKENFEKHAVFKSNENVKNFTRDNSDAMDSEISETSEASGIKETETEFYEFKIVSNEAIAEEMNSFFGVKLNTDENISSGDGRITKQITQNLASYYKKSSGENPNFKMQLFIEGTDSFTGYISVENDNCEVCEGEYENPDITVNAESDIWNEILRGKKSAQKSFMTGIIKVTGNFVLLSKFDRFFDAVK